MASPLVRLLHRLGEIQATYPKIIIGAALVFTIIMALGVPKISLQTDLAKELPEHVPSLDLIKDVGTKFGDSDAVFIVVSIDPESQVDNRILDIRDPRVIEYIYGLDEILNKEAKVSRTYSFAPLVRDDGLPRTLSESMSDFSTPQARQFFNKDYSATILFAFVNLGASEKEAAEIVDIINADMNSVARPPGLKVSLTGNPLMRITLFDLLIKDAGYTIFLSALIILILLLITQKPKTKALLIFTPLSAALIWTLGLMGWLDIKLSIGTVGVGAMILGLGVEYGIFVVKRYEEERITGKNQIDSMRKVMPGVGLAITASASTTIVGFLALLLASMPMIHHLGITLALGIFFSYIAAVVVNPALLVQAEILLDRRCGGGPLD